MNVKRNIRRTEHWLAEQQETGLLPPEVEVQARFAALSYRTLDQPRAMQARPLAELAERDNRRRSHCCCKKLARSIRTGSE